MYRENNIDAHTRGTSRWRQRFATRLFGRFYGVAQFAAGVWVGVELEEPLGKNDGSVQGVAYFSCEAKMGGGGGTIGGVPLGGEQGCVYHVQLL